MLFCVLFTTIYLYQESTNWTDKIGNDMKTSAFENLEMRVYGKSVLAEMYFNKIMDDIDIKSNYSHKLIHDQLSIKNNYTDYFGVTSVDSSNPTLSAGKNFKNTVTYKHGITTYSSFTNYMDTNVYGRKTSTLQNVWRALVESDSRYAGTFMGLEDGFYRYYPYVRTNDYPTMSYTCSTTNSMVTGYDPRCRIWYFKAKSANNTIFSPPYTDALTKKTIITAARSVWFDGNLVGVLGSDIQMSSMEEKIISGSVMTNGLSFIIDDTGVVISGSSKSNSDQVLPQFKNVLLTDSSDKTAFNAHQTALLNDQNGKFSYGKNGETWHMFFRKIRNTPYIVCSTVPETDIFASSEKLSEKMYKLSAVYMGVTIAILFVAIIILIWANHHVSEKITSQLSDTIEKLESITDNNLDVEMNQAEPESSSMQVLCSKLQSLLHALRFGNIAYHKGDIHKALCNYQIVLDLMQKTNNVRGEGVCLNNMGAAYMSDKKSLEPEQYYTKAIANARTLLKEAEDSKNNYSIRFYKIVLAKRFMNYGVYFNEVVNNKKEAEKYFRDSISLHRESENDSGENEVCVNLGQLYIDRGDIGNAKEYINCAYSKARDPMANNPKQREANQYAEMNKGLLAFGEKDYEQAFIWFARVLLIHDRMSANVFRKCAKSLIETCEHTGRVQVKQYLENLTGLYSRKPLKIYFVLDQSWSMDEKDHRKGPTRLQVCKDSIKQIIATNISNTDYVAMYTFDTIVHDTFPLTQKSDNATSLGYKIDSIKTAGRTAFYTAVETAISSSLNDGVANCDTWIIALTDGADNESKHNSLSNVKKQLKQSDINIILITVGNEVNFRDINDIVKSCRTQKGMHIEAKDVEAIQIAFTKAAQHMVSGAVNLERF
jgi:tetratricopeptide (TPR) repeat protein